MGHRAQGTRKRGGNLDLSRGQDRRRDVGVDRHNVAGRRRGQAQRQGRRAQELPVQ